MHLINIGVKIPDIYVCENKQECNDAKHYGLPYVLRPAGYDDEKIAAAILWRTLNKLFPHIRWEEYFGFTPRDSIIVWVPGSQNEMPEEIHTGDGQVVDIAEDRREFSGGMEPGQYDYEERTLFEYVGDRSSEVKIEELQALHMLPTFLDDIAEAIKRNLYGQDWTEGYNKKLGVPIGNFNAAAEKPNLIILDISNSIPRGISATMLTLIATLKEQANAALIVTGSTSLWWDAGEELPSPQWIRNHCGYANEYTQFYNILRTKIFGKHWGNVIVFGDTDAPSLFRNNLCGIKVKDTTVDKVWCFHTWKKEIPGYGEWTEDICEVFEYNTSWCKIMQ